MYVILVFVFDPNLCVRPLKVQLQSMCTAPPCIIPVFVCDPSVCDPSPPSCLCVAPSHMNPDWCKCCSGVAATVVDSRAASAP